VPSTWSEAGFDRLRAEGALRVSAKRHDHRTRHVRIEAEVDSEVCLRDPFDGCEVKWNRSDVRQVGADYCVTLRAGESLEGTYN